MSFVACKEVARPAAESAHVSSLQTQDPRTRGLERRGRRAPALLAQTPRSNARRLGLRAALTRADRPDLGDLVVALLAGTLAGLRDELERDGFDGPAQLVADLVEIADDYLVGIGRRRAL